MHPIQRYLDESGVSQAELARRIGCSGTMLSFVIRDLRGASLELAQRIEAETGGAVTAGELRCRPIQPRPKAAAGEKEPAPCA